MSSTSESGFPPQRVLHVLTETATPLARVLTEEVSRESTKAAQVIDLAAGPADYDALLDAIFAADSVVVW